MTEEDIQILLLSLRVALVSTIVLIPVGTFLGWLFSRKDFPGKTFLDGVVNVPLVLPPVVTGYFLLYTLGPNSLIGNILQGAGIQLAFTWFAVVIAAAVVSLPLLVKAVRVAIDAVDPGLEDASRTLRAGELRTFFYITLPLARQGVISGGVLAFARALGEFGATIVFAGNLAGETRTIPLVIFSYLNQIDGETKARNLVVAAIIFAYISILLNEWLVRRWQNNFNKQDGGFLASP